MNDGSGDLSLYEMARTLVRMEGEINRRLGDVAQTLSQMVTRDLHDAHRAAMQRDIDDLVAEIRAERERRAADKRMVTAAFITAGLSLVVAVVAAALLISPNLPGG
ncbi:hypothetical protein [Herbidospora mongoliensis]|uniref:hypothetical protein n=1 Tax=Herbidospora mongoliensis TaxID=688067 RepID=UPI0008300BAA|nr:hypothetical protein [Herbidospora mongoliensis]